MGTILEANGLILRTIACFKTVPPEKCTSKRTQMNQGHEESVRDNILVAGKIGKTSVGLTLSFKRAPAYQLATIGLSALDFKTFGKCSESPGVRTTVLCDNQAENS